MPPRAFTDEQAKEFEELYRAGFTQVQLAAQLGSNAAIDAAALLYVDGKDALARKRLDAAKMILAGSRGTLVGTIRDPWSNPHAVAWAESQMLKAA